MLRNWYGQYIQNMIQNVKTLALQSYTIQKHYCSLKKTLLNVLDARTKLQLKVKCINCRSFSGVHIECSILDITCTDGKRLHYHKSENKHRRCYKAHCLLNIFHCYDSYHVHLGGVGEFKQMQCTGSQRNSVRASRHQKVYVFLHIPVLWCHYQGSDQMWFASEYLDL